MKNKRAQVSVEYLVVIGFVIFILMGILGISFIYAGIIRDKIKMSQIEDFANKIISTAESVFYDGVPSKETITVFLPENVLEINIIDNSLIIGIQASSGINRRGFSSKVPIDGGIPVFSGLKKIKIEAYSNNVVIGV